MSSSNESNKAHNDEDDSNDRGFQRAGGRGGRGDRREETANLRISELLFDVSEGDADHIDDSQDQRAKGGGTHVISYGKVRGRKDLKIAMRGGG
jgi:hypothetical protein